MFKMDKNWLKYIDFYINKNEFILHSKLSLNFKTKVTDFLSLKTYINLISIFLLPLQFFLYNVSLEYKMPYLSN